MLLPFSTTHNGKPTNFPALILLGFPDVNPGKKHAYDFYVPELMKAQKAGFRPKIHTVRDDTNRWGKGKDIHFVTGNRTADQRIFGHGLCMSTQTIQFFEDDETQLRLYIDGRLLSHEEAVEFALNDGFPDWEGFCSWLCPTS